jgi:hypothetical protein
MRLVFRRTHCAEDRQNPEEKMMDVIAGHFGFRPPAGFEFETSQVSFQAIDQLREQLCSEASKQSALISFVKFWPTPCLLIRAELALKRVSATALTRARFHSRRNRDHYSVLSR